MQIQRFGDLLKRFRGAAGLSQEELAERASMSAHSISSIERGVRRAPYRDTVALLVEALALDPADRESLEAAAEQGRKRAPRAISDHPFDVPANNLPAQLTSFVGRVRDVEEIQALLGANRLVTITGAGGIGETRVALDAEAVCIGDGLAAREIIDGLASLVEKSLVVADDSGQSVRYGFLEPARAFAFEQLTASGEQPVIAAAHARWMGAFADWAYEEYHHVPPRRRSEFVAPESRQCVCRTLLGTRRRHPARGAHRRGATRRIYRLRRVSYGIPQLDYGRPRANRRIGRTRVAPAKALPI